MKEKEKLTTAKEVCEILKISQRTLYRLIKSGRLPAFKVGHDWRFRYGEVDKYLEGKIILESPLFYDTVMKKYRAAPDKYEITENEEGGWLSLTEAYQSVCPPTEYFPKIRFTYGQWRQTGVKILRVMPHSFHALPLNEVKYWQLFKVI